MNLGWIDRNENDEDGTIQHEFGHAIGFEHEHALILDELVFYKEKIYAYCEKKAGWSRAKTNANIFDFPNNQLFQTAYDRDSIMHYDFSFISWTLTELQALAVKGICTKQNTCLSIGDKQMALQVYPRIETWIELHFGCPEATCSSKSVGKRFHKGDGGLLQLSSRARIKCTQCNIVHHMKDWKFGCSDHSGEYKGTTSMTHDYALGMVIMNRSNNPTVVSQLIEFLDSDKW